MATVRITDLRTGPGDGVWAPGTENVETVHARCAPTIPVSTSPRL